MRCMSCCERGEGEGEGEGRRREWMKLVSAGLQAEHMPGNKYGNRNSTRIERLMREHELRKLNRAFNFEEGSSRGEIPWGPGTIEHDAEDEQTPAAAAAVAAAAADEDDEEEEQEEEEETCEDTSAFSRMNSNEGFCIGRDRTPFKQRLLVVANRLPVSAIRRGEESWSLEISAGGLVSALLGVRDVDAKWIGWAGVNVPDEVGQKALTKALATKN